jgi:hypothetical protein
MLHRLFIQVSSTGNYWWVVSTTDFVGENLGCILGLQTGYPNCFIRIQGKHFKIGVEFSSKSSLRYCTGAFHAHAM